MKYAIYKYLDSLTEAYSESTERIPGLTRNPKEVIRTVEFYSNNQYMSGNLDELGREKPFYNVGNYRVMVAKVATDLDIKDIKFEPDSLKYSVQTMLINKELFNLLKEMNFSRTLNEMGLKRPKYGGVLIKKSKEKGKLMIDVVDWVNLDFDPNDVLNGVIIENYYMQPSELKAMSDVWNNIDEVLEAHEKATKNKPTRIKIRQISGELPDYMYPENEENSEYINKGEYKRMRIYCAEVNKKKFLLYYEYEKENPYKYLAWEEVGNSLGRGVWEDGFESQVWVNDSMISMKNAMNLAGKVILGTDSQKISGNAITGVDNGHIFQFEPGRSLTSLNLSPSNMPQFERIIELWNQQYDRVASTYDANTGEAPTAGTPYSQTALLNQVANSPFEYRREEWGIWLNEVLNDWILPEVKSRIIKDHDLVADYSDEELDIIDEAFANFESNKKIKETMLERTVTPEEQMIMKDEVKAGLNKFGKKREIKIPEKFLDIKGKITANITGELKNKAVILQSLDSIFRTVISTFNPNTGQYAALEDPTLSKIFGQIVEMAGIPLSSAQLKSGKTSTPATNVDLSAIKPVQSA